MIRDQELKLDFKGLRNNFTTINTIFPLILLN